MFQKGRAVLGAQDEYCRTGVVTVHFLVKLFNRKTLSYVCRRMQEPDSCALRAERMDELKMYTAYAVNSIKSFGQHIEFAFQRPPMMFMKSVKLSRWAAL